MNCKSTKEKLTVYLPIARICDPCLTKTIICRSSVFLIGTDYNRAKARITTEQRHGLQIRASGIGNYLCELGEAKSAPAEADHYLCELAAGKSAPADFLKKTISLHFKKNYHEKSIYLSIHYLLCISITIC